MGVSVIRTSHRYTLAYSSNVERAVRSSEAVLNTSNGHTREAFHSCRHASRARKIQQDGGTPGPTP
eukprot:1637392-Pyramimonas_sp.AAC.1